MAARHAIPRVFAAAERQARRRLPAVRTGRVGLTDGNHGFNRPGRRLVDRLEILTRALPPGQRRGDAPGPRLAIGHDGSIRPAPAAEPREPSRVTI